MKRTKAKIKELLFDILGEIIVVGIFFGIGAAVIYFLGYSLDSEPLDFELIALIGVGALILIGAIIWLILLLIGKKQRKNGKKRDTDAAIGEERAKIPERTYTFTVDDNVRFLREICERNYTSIFEHPYLATYKRMNEIFGVKVQLNLFWQDEKFNLSEMTDRYRDEWEAASSWLLLSFHSKLENVSPYESAPYDEVFADCAAVHKEIIRFASEKALAKTTTVHYCRTTEDGCRALYDNGVRGLLGLYGTESEPRTSYQCNEKEAEDIRRGKVLKVGGIYHASIDLILNKFTRDEILEQLSALNGRPRVKIMIHEQYFYEDYKAYQADFPDKLYDAFLFLKSEGYESAFFEETITEQ